MSDHAPTGEMIRKRPPRPAAPKPHQGASQPVASPMPPQPATPPAQAVKPAPVAPAPVPPAPAPAGAMPPVGAMPPAGAPKPNPLAARLSGLKMPGHKPAGAPAAPASQPKPAVAKPAPSSKPGAAKPAGAASDGAAKPGTPGAAKDKKPVGQGKITSQSGRRAHLRITKLDLLAIVKMSFLFAFCVAVVIFVASFLLWNLLVATGAISGAQNLLNSVMGNPNGSTTVQLSQFLNTTRVVGFLAGVSVISVFLLTLLGTIFGALYNLASVMFGGLEVTLEV